ncbi:MAG: homocysteine S-methyltransferase family protein [Caldilinea sp.]|nr:homocysteine S-methyltransferase family protein [Caldilinea sp.]
MRRKLKNLLGDRLAGGRVLILDGGLATELERRGADLSDALWSARWLVDDPEQITAVHLDYLRAGADVLITASYQASLEGFQRRGLQAEQVFRLWQLSVELALDAVAHFQREVQAVQRPLVAASIGPYGAFLADGSEYRGDYGVRCAELAAWHRPRMQVLAGTAAEGKRGQRQFSWQRFVLRWWPSGSTARRPATSNRCWKRPLHAPANRCFVIQTVESSGMQIGVAGWKAPVSPTLPSLHAAGMRPALV